MAGNIEKFIKAAETGIPGFLEATVTALNAAQRYKLGELSKVCQKKHAPIELDGPAATSENTPRAKR